MIFYRHFYTFFYLSFSKNEIINVKKVTNWGEWSHFETCKPTSYVIGFRQKVEEPIGNGDDTALNTIELICSDQAKSRIRGASSIWGKWSDEEICKDKQGVKGFQLKQQSPQGEGDDTAANGLRLICKDDSVLMAKNDGQWGEWSEIVKCSGNNNVICGLRVQIEKMRGKGDDTALNDVEFKCCSE